MLGIWVDLRNELHYVEREAIMLARSIEIYQQSDHIGEDEAFAWLITQGLASGIEKIYTGCERVMAKIATSIDQSSISREEGWHVSLLTRMANPFPGIRDAVLTEACLKKLDLLRAFRHRERNSYGLFLDPDVVVERAAATSEIFGVFKHEVDAFIVKMSGSGEAGE